MKLNITSRFVAAIAQFKATSDIRYYLMGVYVEPIPTGGVLIVGTNGHALAVWRDLSGEIERPAILRVGRPLLTACAGKGKRLQIADDRLVVVDTKGLELYAQNKYSNKPGDWAIEAKYPDFRKVLKNGHSGLPMDPVNPALMALVSKAIDIGGSVHKGVSLTQAEPMGAITVLCNEESDFIAAIMPLRGQSIGYPDWVKAEIPTAPIPGQQPSDAV